MPKKIIHGDDLLYRFFQDALRDKPKLFAAVPQLLITTTAIWLPVGTYQRWPVLLPWVVRDPKCRGNARKGITDQWSTPDRDGFLRDDNSLVKSLPRALVVQGPRGSHVNGKRIGSEFVASHIWRMPANTEMLANRIPLLNTFVPNIVWLPRQVSKLTDREGGIVQQTLQAMSYRIFREATVTTKLYNIVEEAWAMLPRPTLKLQTFCLEELNWFNAINEFYRTRSARLRSVIDALDDIELGLQLPKRVVTTRYATGLPAVEQAARSLLKEFLMRFL